MSNKPQVLLLGNGLNYDSDGKSWTDLLRSMNSNPHISDETKLTSPMPLQAIIMTNDNVDDALKKRGGDFYGHVTDEGVRKRLVDLLSIGFDHILTTNYSYELECAAYDVETISEYKLKKHRKFLLYDDIARAESKYLLHTYYEAEKNGVENKIWHIHGEARNPQGMILGHYYYGILLQRYIQLLEKRKDSYQKYQIKGEDYPIHSWLDAFILGDVYVLGFGYNLSEFDLWWLLNRKKREKAEKGRVHFYEMEKASDGTIDERLELLRLMDVEIHDLDMVEDDNYTVFYQKAIEDIYVRVKR